MGYPPVVVVDSGGVPRTQVAEGVSAPAYTVVESGARPITLTTNAPPIALFNEDGSHYTGTRVRVEPASADLFYAVMEVDAGGSVVRWQRDVGGSGGTDLGNQWPEFRVTGLGTLADYSGDAATETVWNAQDDGAFDFVARTSALVFFCSYHGLGAGGALNSQSIEMDGVAVDHTLAVEGSRLVVRNSTTATDGTDTVTRDLSVASRPDGTLLFTLHSASASAGINLIYFGMPIGGSDAYTELNAKYSSDWNSFGLGTVNADASLAGATAVRMRDPVTGAFVAMSGDLPSLSGFVQARAVKEDANDRTKAYVGQFSAATGLAGAELVLEWGIGATGSTSSPTNLLEDADWDAPPWVYVQSGGTVAKSGNDLVMTWTAGTANLRAHAEIQTSEIGGLYAVVVDFVSQTSSSGAREFYAGSNVNGSSVTPAAAATRSPAIGRNIMVYTATQDAPNQRLALRASPTASMVATFRNPAAYELVA